MEKGNAGVLTTKQIFEKRYGRPLTSDELFSIQQNLKGFFELLIRIDKRIKKKGGEISNEKGSE